jgi:hypothetical protein
VNSFQTAKLLAMEVTDLGKDALHVHVGLIVFLATAVLLKRSFADWRPIGMVLLASVAGELWDLVSAFALNKAVWAESFKDVLNTMFWPAALFGLARFTAVLKR